jgi:hypothetical protein
MSCINLVFVNKQEPWRRPEYSTTELMVNSLKVDFEDAIKHEFIAESYRSDTYKRFPRQESIALAVEVNALNECILPAVLKNVADALQKKAYSDDYKVYSILATLEIGEEESVKVGILVDTRIRPDEIIKHVFSKSFITFKVETTPVDKVLSIPKLPNETMVNNKINKQHQSYIEQQISVQYSGGMLLDDVKISIDVDTLSTESDLDNIALNYILALEGVIIKDIKQVKALWLNLSRNKSDKASMKIEVL